jgi:hypothetical protein
MRVRLEHLLSIIPKQTLKLVLVAIVVLAILFLLGPVAGGIFDDIVYSVSDDALVIDETLYAAEPVPDNAGDAIVSEAVERILAFKEAAIQQETSMKAARTIIGQAVGPVIDAIIQDAIASGDDLRLEEALELKQEFESVYDVRTRSKGGPSHWR